MTETGRIVAVDVQAYGDQLVGAHAAGSVVLTLDDAADFDEDGGWLRVGEVVLPYVSADIEADTVLLAAPLPADAPDGESVDLWDARTATVSQDVVAYVAVEGADFADDTLVAIVDHALIPLLTDGIRDAAGEAVALERRGASLYVVDLLGQAARLDGSLIDPDTLGGALPEEAPAVSPALTATGTPTAVVLRAENVDATTEIEYHVSTDPEFVPSAETLSAPATRATVYIVATLPDGTAFSHGVTYYFRAVARNIVGAAAPSEAVAVELDADALREVIAEQIVAGFILTGAIQVGNITIDANEGIVIPQANGQSTYLRADGSGNTFAGQGTFDALDVLGNLNIRGLTNFVNGLLTLAEGVGDPGQAPTVTADWHAVKMPSSDPRRRGLVEAPSPDTWISSSTVGTVGSSVQWMLKDGSAGWNLFDVEKGWLALGGVTRAGDRYYVLCAQASGNTWVKNNWRVLIYDAAAPYTYRGSWSVEAFETGSAYPAIGEDGEGRLVIAGVSAGGNLFGRVYTTSGTRQSAYYLTVNGWGQSHVMGVTRSSLGMGGRRWVLASQTSMHVYSEAGAALPAEGWPKGNSAPVRGLAIAGGKWHTIHDEHVVEYETTSGEWDFAYTWVDDTPSGDAQTLPSPVRRIAPARFARWTVRLPTAPPFDGTADGANTAYLYAAPKGSPLVLQERLPVGTLSKRFTSLSTTGTPAPTVSTFATRTSTARGRIQSAGVDGYDRPVIALNGDGSGRVGPLEWRADGALAAQSYTSSAGNVTTTAGSGFYYPTGLAEIVFVAPPSGRMMLTYTAYLKAPSDGSLVGISPEVREGPTVRAGTVLHPAQVTTMIANANVQMVRTTGTFVVHGLTPGNTYNVYTGVYRTAANGNVNNSYMTAVPL